MHVWPISQHLPFFEEWMFVMFVIAQLVLGGVFCGNQSNCRICRNYRICILIGECWNGVDSLGILEFVELPGEAGRSWMTGMSEMSLECLERLKCLERLERLECLNVCSNWSAFGRSCGWMPGMSCRTHGWISRRSPCLLCVEFLFWNLECSSSTQRALCLLHVELDSGWRILWMYCSVHV